MRDTDTLILEKLYSDIEDDNGSEEKCREIVEFIESILPQLASSAESVYDAWDQTDEGDSETYGSGGICDIVAQEMASEFDKLKPEHLKDWDSFTFYKENDCHTDFYVVNHQIKKIFEIGLPPHAYESGGGYTWKKKKEHEINPSAFDINDTYLDYENFFDDNGEWREF